MQCTASLVAAWPQEPTPDGKISFRRITAQRLPLRHHSPVLLFPIFDVRCRTRFQMTERLAYSSHECRKHYCVGCMDFSKIPNFQVPKMPLFLQDQDLLVVEECLKGPIFCNMTSLKTQEKQ